MVFFVQDQPEQGLRRAAEARTATTMARGTEEEEEKDFAIISVFSTGRKGDVQIQLESGKPPCIYIPLKKK